jgi:sugar-specific transcriptional regulator TrmB
MLIRNEDVETLICLGLTERQAKVYLALVRMGISKVDAISLGSTVHRSEVYRVVADLEKKGLVHVKLSTPKLFSAVPITDAVEILIKRRKDEFFKVQEKAE